MTGPLLTIGIPTYNEQKFLRKTLESIRDQSFKDYVAYICDDCSTDDTLKIANEFAASDSRFKVWPSDKKTTFTENWGRSLLKCESEYFVWIGAHDILHKDYFKEAIDILKSDSTVVLVYPKSLALDIDDKVGEPMDSDIETNGDPEALP